MQNYLIIGIDETGRGPLAGPLVVGGVLLLTRNRKEERKILEGIRDSKKLSGKKREFWFAKIKKHPQVRSTHVIISPKVIDKINIAQAANLGADRVCQRLLKKGGRKRISCKNSTSQIASDRLLSGMLSGRGTGKKRTGRNSLRVKDNIKILLDGGLKLKKDVPHEVIIKGDEKIPVIAAASIVAKVTRDRIMMRLHKKFPEYGFNKHKGYGTRLHRDNLIRVGASEEHRHTFLNKII